MYRLPDWALACISVTVAVVTGFIIVRIHHITSNWDIIAVCALSSICYCGAMGLLTQAARAIDRRAKQRQAITESEEINPVTPEISYSTTET